MKSSKAKLAYNAKYRAEHKKERKEYDTKRYLENKDEIDAKAKKYQQDNPEKVALAQRNYRENNREALIEYDRKRYPERREQVLKQQAIHYQEHREELKLKQRKYRQPFKDYKVSIGCLNKNCGWKLPYIANMLDFHHVDPATKEFNISSNIFHKDLWNEIRKCTLVCRNCHSLIHSGAIDASTFPTCKPLTHL